jgi:hypothetical protein
VRARHARAAELPHGPPWSGGSDDVIATPGRATSGFSCSETGVGPPEEKSAIPSDVVVAATVIADAAFAGELIEPKPNWLKSFPAATTGTTPAFAAASIALHDDVARRLHLRLAERQVDHVPCRRRRQPRSRP